MAYEVTALVTFWVDTVSSDEASTTIENLEESWLFDKVEVMAVQINRVDKHKPTRSKP